ncbi:MAG: hypothetical protein II876_09875 [Synergistaceae bacterium]|nr:hypothetical protein [Synergistaceae bacterium]
MLSTIATREMIHEHLDEYLDMMENGQEIIMTKDRQEIGRFLPRGKVVTLAAERLAGILRGDIDVDKIREEALRRKYEIAD